MFYARPEPLADDKVPCRDSIGGSPVLPAGQEWPVCPKSGERMVLFFQFDIRPEFALPFAPGSHFSVFMSPQVNEIPTFNFIPSGQRLPERFWTGREPHFSVLLHPPGMPEQPMDPPDSHLEHRRLIFEPVNAIEEPGLYLGGKPQWLQDPEEHPGPNGESMAFICQLTENYGFPKRLDAPSQPDSFSHDEYCLFLGNQSYFFGMPSRPEPEAVWVVVQN